MLLPNRIKSAPEGAPQPTIQLLINAQIRHINAVTHEGKVVLVGTDADGKLWYAVKQDGFEDSYLEVPESDRIGWEDWQLLELPNEDDDQSVIEKEKSELTDRSDYLGQNKLLIQSLYKTYDLTAVAPVQLVSALGYIYVFRQSKSNTLLVDRFVLDGLTNRLNRKLDVRFKRSRQKHKPIQSQRKEGKSLINVDTLDFVDIQDKPFYEPTTELNLINNLHEGWFSVVLLPTQEQDKYRWHIFTARKGAHTVEITTLRASESGLFDIEDYTLLEPESRRIAGIIKRKVSLGDVTVEKGVAATRYDIQRERETDAKDKDGKTVTQLLRESVRVMLVVGTSRGYAISLSFAVATDGTLSKIAPDPEMSQICRSVARQVLLPPNILDDIKAIGRVRQPRQGYITQLQSGEDNEVIVVSSQSPATSLTETMQVIVSGSRDYNGLHSGVNVIDTNTFEITLPNNSESNSTPVQWSEVLTPDIGLLYNGMITACEMTSPSKLKVTAFNHGLKNGDAVQIENSRAYDGTYTVSKIDNQRFCLKGVSWQGGTAINVKQKTEKRRGIVLDGVSDYITLPLMNHDFSEGLTVEAWVFLTQLKVGASIIDFGNGAERDNIILQIGGVSSRRDDTKRAQLALTLRQDYELQLIATGGVNALPSTGRRLIAISKDDQNKLSLKVFNDQGNEKISQSEATLASAASEKWDALKLQLKPYWNIRAAKIPSEAQKKIVDAVQAVLPTMPAIFTSYEQNIISEFVLEAKKWIHLAATIDKTGQATLYQDGESITTGSLSLPPSLKRSQNYLGRSNQTPALYWCGKLSQVRLWSRASTAAEIKNGMMLPAREQATGLLGDWRLDAIAEGTQRTIVDFSTNGNDGTVIGENAYINSSVVLQRNLEGTNIEVERYENEDLFAVSERATYREEFEFRLQQVAADGTVSRLTVASGPTFIYKGKKNHSTQAWTPLDDKPSFLTALTDGWCKASCEFTVPDGVSLLRSFGIENIDSSQPWTHIEIRRHKITLISDSITAETYNDNPFKPSELTAAITAPQPQGGTSIQDDYWQRLNALEKAEAVLLKRKQDLERAQRLNLSTSVSENNLNAQIASSQNRVHDLQGEVNTLQTQYNNLVNDPFNYWCYIVAKHSGRAIQALDNQFHDGADIKQGVSYSLNVREMWSIQWRFYKIGEQNDNKGSNIPNCFYIQNRYTEKCLHIRGKESDKRNNHARIDQWTWASAAWQVWQVNKLGDESYQILSKHSLYEGRIQGLDVSGISKDDGGLIQLFPWTSADSRQWYIYKGEPLDSSINNKKQELDAKEDELGKEQRSLQQLKDRQQQDQKELESVNRQLTVIQNEIKNLDLPRSTPVEMNVIATDDRQLTTQSAILDFVRPASRLNAMETCEGTVQLSYFDAQGRMHQTHFDATADRQNTTFEEWLPDAQHHCLNFNAASSVINLSKPINLDAEWTVEAWFFYPFQSVDANFNTYPWTVLVGGSQRQPIVVRDGKHLGTRFDDRFYSSGYNLENLTVGWHHVTAVGKPNSMGSSTLFYIDGEKVGEAVSTAALVLDGKDDFLDCGDNIVLNKDDSKSFTIEFWAKQTTTTTNQNQYIVSQGKQENNKGLQIGFRENDIFTFSFYGFGNGLDTKEAFIDLNWHHWACVYDGDTQKQQIYRDGQLIIEKLKAPNYTGTGNLFVGKALDEKKFSGQINDLRIWQRALSSLEISTNWDKEPIIDKNLRGWWQFSLDKDNNAVATNRVDPKTTVTVHGNPKVERSPVAIAINQIGNASSANQPVNSTNQATNNQPAGKLAEIRVWDVALSPMEIAANSKTLLTGNEPDLVAYYPLNEGMGAKVRNQTGDSNDGKVVGASWQTCALPIGISDNLVIQRAVQFEDKGFIELPLTGRILSADFTVEAWIKVGQSNAESLAILGTDAREDNKGLHLQIRQNKAYFGFWRNDTTGKKDLSANTWYHICFRYDSLRGEQAIFIDGKLDKAVLNKPKFTGTDNLKIGSSSGDTFFNGCIAELRIWNKALTADEIQLGKDQRLTIKKTGLVAYYPLNDFPLSGVPQYVTDLVSNQHVLVNNLNTSSIIDIIDSPVPKRDTLISCEYSTVSKDKSAMMRRFFASPSPQGVDLLPDKRIEQLELQWIGNGQFAPTLLGYIEGAPPIPSENLTLEDNYNGATSVELAISEDVELKWTRSQESAWGSSVDLFVGTDVEQSIQGGLWQIKTVGVKAGFKGNLENSWQFQNETSIASQLSLSMTDKLQLSGTQEQKAHFPHLGKRFIPKNVGYALVISSLADVFVTRLKRSGVMIGYQVIPVENIPPDVNTITFLINPAYTMSGSLDGMTGSSATSQRFFKHVPEMRSRFGSLYPASYYRLHEAYDLKEKIDKQDKDREAYFVQFDSKIFGKYRKSVDDEDTLNEQIDSGSEPRDISLTLSEDKPDEARTSEQKKADEEARQKKQEDSFRTAQAQQSGVVKQKQAEIDKLIKDPNLQVNASAKLADWQKRMENIQIRSGKRNIVNTYVWDADGGFHAEAQSFANTAEHSIGGAFMLNSAIGFAGEFSLFGGAQELTAQTTFSLTQIMSKTETRSKGIQLNVDLGGVESRGITNYDDLPLLPGEKVDRYRFMSFYLEGSTNHFHDFFNYVVDPEWLMSNSEEARALRQARGKANKAWRVLHRVTYVERPALMGFGKDMRQLPPAISKEEQQIDQLKAQVATMEDKLNQILQLLGRKNDSP